MSVSIARTSDDTLLTAPQVAEILSLPESWVRDRTRAGDVPHRRFGKYVRYSRGEVLAWAETLKGGRA